MRSVFLDEVHCRMRNRVRCLSRHRRARQPVGRILVHLNAVPCAPEAIPRHITPGCVLWARVGGTSEGPKLSKCIRVVFRSRSFFGTRNMFPLEVRPICLPCAVQHHAITPTVQAYHCAYTQWAIALAAVPTDGLAASHNAPCWRSTWTLARRTTEKKGRRLREAQHMAVAAVVNRACCQHADHRHHDDSESSVRNADQLVSG